ncbi:hypothetical protein [Agrilutibacter solisilvae]|uniref:Lipoprotein n=1 Tax=Agrilutibacter solisilvae TaxID=2763317 RepID=A0A975ASW4_9GAMM|nr:hypothetical protein [Lysobacter solisilvae]QSX78683.1 hypothetical protein I8J32_001705 [Lysobacter solisilvae]
MRLVLLLLLVVLAGCRTATPPPVAPEPTPVVEPPPPPTTTRGEFLIEADKLDTWNAIGQIAVRTPGVEYEGRAQMLDLYVLRYRGVGFMVLTKAVPHSETIPRLTTRVTATTRGGQPIDDDAVAELLVLFQQALPAEIDSVRARQAAEKAEKAAAGKKVKKKKKKKS